MVIEGWLMPVAAALGISRLASLPGAYSTVCILQLATGHA